jgi:flagellin
MPLTINTNIASLMADRQINDRSAGLKNSFNKLSSGKRITKASDDAAGLAIAMAFLAKADQSAVASRNISDAYSAANIAEGAIESASGIMFRLGELAQQSANGTLSDSQRDSLGQEFNSLVGELDRISQTTEFNGKQLLGGESSSISIQAGTDGSSNSQLDLTLPDVSSSGLALSGLDIGSQSGAREAITKVKGATESLAQSRGEIGSSVARLEAAYSNLQVARENELAAASRIQDLDFAAETSQLILARIGQQAAVAIKSQANVQPEIAKKLLES